MPKITVYTRISCAPCRMLKHWLRSKDIDFEEKDIDSDPVHAQEIMEKTGRLMVPNTVIGDNVVSGANIGLISSLLMV